MSPAPNKVLGKGLGSQGCPGPPTRTTSRPEPWSCRNGAWEWGWDQRCCDGDGGGLGDAGTASVEERVWNVKAGLLVLFLEVPMEETETLSREWMHSGSKRDSTREKCKEIISEQPCASTWEVGWGKWS